MSALSPKVFPIFKENDIPRFISRTRGFTNSSVNYKLVLVSFRDALLDFSMGNKNLKKKKKTFDIPSPGDHDYSRSDGH